MAFISMDEVRKRFKDKSSSFKKGYFDGYNNPKRSLDEVNNMITSGRYDSLSQGSKDFVDGKGKGVEDRRKED